MFGDEVDRDEVDRAARAHALAEWPHEACGVVSGGAYVPVANIAADPAQGFGMPADTWLTHRPQAVIHSHNARLHPHWPSQADMQSQIAADVPFGIVSCDGEVTTPVLWWGDPCLDAPLIGRAFVPGIYDCYALVRAWFWQDRGVRLADFARDARWWNEGSNLLVDRFGEAGFDPIEAGQARPGDGFLMRLTSAVPCHCGLLLDGGLCLHHLDGRLSRREPIGPWLKRITHWVRHGSA